MSKYGGQKTGTQNSTLKLKKKKIKKIKKIFTGLVEAP